MVPTVEPQYRFRACVGQDAIAKRSLKELVSGLLGGSPRQAIAYLLEHEAIDEEELQAIRALIDARKRGEDER